MNKPDKHRRKVEREVAACFGADKTRILMRGSNG